MAADTWVEAVIEIPRGSRNKYELDKATGVIRLDRVLYSSVHYPADYGFIVDTYAADGDPLDILVLVEEPTFPGCHVRARPIGLMRMRDEKGADDKIIAVPVADPRFAQVEELGMSALTGSWRSNSSSKLTRRWSGSRRRSSVGTRPLRQRRSLRPPGRISSGEQSRGHSQACNEQGLAGLPGKHQ